MKLSDIKTPKKDEHCDDLPMFLRPQAGPKLTRKDNREIARKIRSGEKPSLLKRQAE